MTQAPQDIPEDVMRLAKEAAEAPFATTDRPLETDIIEAIARAILSYSKREWRPISEAPRDGTYVDLWAVRGELGKLGMREGRRYTNCVFARPTYGTEPYGEPRWLGLDDQYIEVTPLFFMPLPSPPTKEGE